jgi:hypothetical protein
MGAARRRLPTAHGTWCAPRSHRSSLRCSVWWEHDAGVRGSPSVTVTVDLTADVHAISPLVYGLNFPSDAQLAAGGITSVDIREPGDRHAVRPGPCGNVV